MFLYNVTLVVGRWTAEILVRQMPPDELEMIAKMPAYVIGMDEDDEHDCDDECG